MKIERNIEVTRIVVRWDANLDFIFMRFFRVSGGLEKILRPRHAIVGVLSESAFYYLSSGAGRNPA